MSMLFVASSSTSVDMASGSLALANVLGATLGVWINAVSLSSGDHSIFGLSTGTTAGSSRVKIGVNGTGAIRGNGRCLDTDANQDFVGVAGTVTTGGWHHIAATFDYASKIIKLYYDGALNATSGLLTWGAVPTSNTGSLGMNLGCQHGGGSEYWDGYVEDARCYNRVLSLDELQTVFTLRGRDNIVYGLQHRYVLNEGIGAALVANSVKDSGILQFVGSPTNSPSWDSIQIRKRALN